jgi:hypothetical protein
MDVSAIGRIVLIVGIGITVLGGALLLFGRIPGVNDFINNTTLRVGGGSFTCITPIGLMIVASVVLTIIVNVIIWLLNRP